MPKNTALSVEAPDRIARALVLVAAERARQRKLLAAGAIYGDCSDPLVEDDAKLRVLAEEFGEVARAVDKLQAMYRSGRRSDKVRIRWRRRHLRDELIQNAAVSVAWAESLEETEPC
jgi:hypothetical protein